MSITGISLWITASWELRSERFFVICSDCLIKTSILVTGATGFLGQALGARLLKEGYKVRALHRNPADGFTLRKMGAEAILGDIAHLEDVVEASRGVNAVFHCAALISYSPSQLEDMIRINVEGTHNIIRAVLQNKVEKLVHTSSVVAVGASLTPDVLTEESPYGLKKYNLGYYETKREAERLIQNAVKNTRLDAVILNPSIIFGAGDAAKNSRQLHLKVAQGRFPFYPSGGVNIVHINDVVEGHLLAWKKGRTGERYILGGENITTRDLFNRIAHFGGVQPPRIPLPKSFLFNIFKWGQSLKKWGIKIDGEWDSALVSALYHWYDSAKAREELGYANSCRADDGIRESLQWAREHGLV